MSTAVESVPGSTDQPVVQPETVPVAAAVEQSGEPIPTKQAGPEVSAASDEASAEQSAVPEIQTVFDSTEEFTVKHPLKSKWTLWYTKPVVQGDKTDWSELLKQIVTFDTVEEFWGVYNNIPKASELPLKSDYNLFKPGIRPEWEDEQNKKGGKWAYQFREKSSTDIDRLWLNTLLATIGGTLQEEGQEDEITGVVVTIRKAHYRISIWTKSDNKEDVLKPIGRRFKEILGLANHEKVEFASHSDSASVGSSRARSTYKI
ncbi:translation initiation factor eIF 4e-like domain-containing protein [Lipomyces japonicus]|uniref:translation initiation factor eIF 4e-like domain-containing protein n=1 Tax=Lipomyces japonicus TaxID=56871 RepID=UPI0034CD47ED